MAIYHLSVKTISRGKGQSAVASAAYRSASKLKDEFNNKTFDYSRKSEVAFTKILLPENAPKEFYDRETLWNSIEKNENQINSRLAREIEFALPVELSFDEQKKLACDFAQSFTDVGMCVDLAFHNKKNNPHCHMMLTTRSLDKNGHWLPKNKVSYKLDDNGNKIPVLDKNGFQKKEKNGKKIFEKISSPTNDWDKREKIEEWRKKFQILANDYLKNSNSKIQLDHRSYKRQGVDQIPTIHLGSFDALKERNGQHTEHGDFNRFVTLVNYTRKKLKTYSDCRKNFPTTDDPRNFCLWLHAAKENLTNEQSKMQSFIDSENENLTDAKEKLAQAKKDHEKARTLRDDTYNAVCQTKTSDPSYNEKFERYNKAREDFSESIRIVELREKELALAKENYITELKKDTDFLQVIHKDFEIQFNKHPDPTYTKYKNGGESYQDFLINNQNELKLSLKNYDTSAPVVRQLRLAEQELQNKKFLTILAKSLDIKDASLVAVDCLSSGNAFNVPFHYDDSVSIHTTVVDKKPTESKDTTATSQSDNPTFVVDKIPVPVEQKDTAATFKSDIPTFAVDKTPATSKTTTATPQPDIQPVLKEIPPEIQVFADAMKKVPPTDDLHTFYLWHHFSIKHIQQEQEKLLQEKEVEIENLKKIAIKNTEEFKKLQEVENRTKNYCKDYYNLKDQRTKLAIKKWELENNQPTKNKFFGLVTTEEFKNWKKELRDINDQLKQNNDQTESAENIMRLSEQELGNARRELEDKKYSMTVSSTKTIELDFKLNELGKDLAYLENIWKKLHPHINDLRSKNDSFKKINKKLGGKDKISYLQFIAKFDKNATMNLQNFNTSATFIRQLRLAEQKIQQNNLLANLVKTLADSLSNTNAPSMATGTPNITDKDFEMDNGWNLMSELKKQEILRKRKRARY